MQRLPGKDRTATRLADNDAPSAGSKGRAATVAGIPDQRMTDGCEVNANLMRAAGFEPAEDQRAVTEALAHFVVRNGVLTRRNDRHRGALHRMASDRRIDRTAASDVSQREREIFAAHA